MENFDFIMNNHSKIVEEFFQILFDTFYFSIKRIKNSLSINAVTLSVQTGLNGRNLTQSKVSMVFFFVNNWIVKCDQNYLL